MAAPLGNEYAKGGSGGTSYVDRSLVARFKGLVLKDLIKIAESPDMTNKKWEMLMKMGPHCIPKDLDLTSGGKAIVLPFEVIAKHAIDTGTKADSEGQPPV